MSKSDAHEAAINQAVADVNEALANYDVSNRPRWMQRGLGKVVSQFGMFPLHMMLLMTTNLFQMMPFFNKEGKAVAAKKFFGIYLTAGSIAGLAGLPLFAPVIGALAYAFKKMADDDEAPEELRDMDPQMWFRDVFLPQQLGELSVGGVPLSELLYSGPLNAMTELAISQRIGLHDIFSVFNLGGRESKETKTTEEAFTNWLLEHAGPSVSVARSGFAAYDAYQRGDFDKMLEKSLPAVARNVVLAERIRKEGIKEPKSGEVIIPADKAFGYAMAQAIGFRPDAMAIMAENNFKMTAADQRIQNERNLILERLKVQARKDTDEGFDRMQKILEEDLYNFNVKHPREKLPVKQAIESVKDDLKARARTRAGYNFNKKNAGRTDEALSRMEDRLERMQKRAGVE
jgi:hypothetical protein